MKTNETDNELTFLQKISVEILWAICRGFAMLPYFMRHYVLGPIFYFTLRYALRYRRRVIMTNLRNSFPDKSEKELRRICALNYRNLSEQIINIISQSGVSDEKLCRRIRFNNADDILREVGDRNVIFMTAHFGSWEAGSTMSLISRDHTFVAVYHKIENPVFDELMKRIRQHTNVKLVTMKRMIRYFIDHRDTRPVIMGLISDQNPTYRLNFHWYRFLNQWTVFYNGAELLARKYDLPVYYFSPRRLKAGVYEGDLIKIYDGKEKVEDHVITERYVRLLEKDIIATPEVWMWSHRRWKYTPPAELDKPDAQGGDHNNPADTARFADGRTNEPMQTPELLINPEPAAKKA